MQSEETIAIPPPGSDKIAEADLLQNLFSSAIHDASLAMARWTNSKITLSLDNVQACPPSNVCHEMHLEDQPLATVLLDLEGNLGGTIVLIFTEKDGRRLASSLLETAESADAEWTELETSALNETGNILFCAFVNAVTRLIDRPLIPTVPIFARDSSIAKIRETMTARFPDRDAALICQTAFHCHRHALKWHVIFVPTAALRAEMENDIEPYLERR